MSFLDYFPVRKIPFYSWMSRCVSWRRGRQWRNEFLEAQKRRVESGMEVTEEEARLYTTRELAARMDGYMQYRDVRSGHGGERI